VSAKVQASDIPVVPLFASLFYNDHAPAWNNSKGNVSDVPPAAGSAA
jgi:hypothetical protein